MSLFSIWTVARYEAKLLLRSWAFRIFSGLAILFIGMMSRVMGTEVGNTPHFLTALSSALPLMNIKFLNVYQGVIAAFLATEFIKRDRRHDTTQVVFTRSFSNMEYVLGKVLGILFVFAVLNFAVLLFGFIIHLFFSPMSFAWEPWVLFPVFISFTTLVFVIGASLMLVTVLRVQALAFVVMLGYSLVSLIYLGPKYHQIFDVYAFHQPMLYSDFVGLTNLTDILLLRGAYFLLGLGFIAVTVFLMPRLRQSAVANTGAAAVGAISLAAAILFAFVYFTGQTSNGEYRQQLREISADVLHAQQVNVVDYDIDFSWEGDHMAASAKMKVVNNTSADLNQFLLTLNPGLTVFSESDSATVKQDHHLVHVSPRQTLKPQDTLVLTLGYEGVPDDRYCYLDVPDERYNDLYRIWVCLIPKRYGFVSDNYVHLTHELGWYPIAGLPTGASYPSATQQDHSNYKLAVTVPDGLTAISQGMPTVTKSGEQTRYSFTTEKPLNQISLTIGEYEKREIEVDSVLYALYYLPEHDYFDKYFTDVSDTLPEVIRGLRNEYEVALGLEYDFPRLSVVEVPIQFYSYGRQWTTAHEMVQPEVVCIPEVGTICSGADFRRQEDRADWDQERNNQLDSPHQIQAGYLTNFAKYDLLGLQTATFGVRRQSKIEPNFEILPMLVSYRTSISSEKWPLLNFAFESHFQGRVTPPENTRVRRWRGLTDPEKANLLLKDNSLEEVMRGQSSDAALTTNAIRCKGSYLLTLVEAKLGNENFAADMTDLLIANRGRQISDLEFTDMLASMGDVDLGSLIESWYSDKSLPGYIVEEVEAYNVLDGERTRTQVKFRISNPTGVDGAVELSFRYRRMDRGRRHFGRGSAMADHAQMLPMPAQTAKTVGLLFDSPIAEMTVETFVSQNLPKVLITRFREQQLRRDEQPYDEILSESIADKPVATDTSSVVDNEDDGFDIVDFVQPNWLRKTMLSFFDEESDNTPYVAMRVWDAPGAWKPTTSEDFYGEFVRSAYFKQAGDGQNRVMWETELMASGDYDVYYFAQESHSRRGGGRRRNQGWEPPTEKEKHFAVYHDNGVEEVAFDPEFAEQGWNYLGTFRLSEGETRVELTDQSEGQFVTADAVKWVLR